MENVTKATYEAPKLVDLGTFEAMTQGSQAGNKGDKFGSLPKKTS